MKDNVLNLIIGKNCNLSQELKKSLKNTILIGSLNIDKELKAIDFVSYKNVNIIFNQFQKSTLLYNFEKPIEYIERSILSTSIVFDFLIKNNIKINKVIYTSSSSVYGKNIECSESSLVNPLSLTASLKVANEQLVKSFCEENAINYTIARIFNLYGGDDSFSIISKIIRTYQEDSVLSVINNGEAIRDYIHISDVVYCYSKLLLTNGIPIVNIGTSNGKSLLYIFEYLKQSGITIKTSDIKKDELRISVSSNDLLVNIIGEHKFLNLESYLLKKLKRECLL